MGMCSRLRPGQNADDHGYADATAIIPKQAGKGRSFRSQVRRQCPEGDSCQRHPNCPDPDTIKERRYNKIPDTDIDREV